MNVLYRPVNNPGLFHQLKTHLAIQINPIKSYVDRKDASYSYQHHAQGECYEWRCTAILSADEAFFAATLVYDRRDV